MVKSRNAGRNRAGGRIVASAALTALFGTMALAAPGARESQGAEGRGQGQARGQGQGRTEPAAPFLTFYSAGADAFLKSPKDKWLLDAVKRVERDGIQLPPELDRDFRRDPQARIMMTLVRELLTTRIAGSIGLAAPQRGGPPMPEGQFTFYGNALRSGDTLESTFIDAMRAGGVWSQFQPDPSNASLRTMQTPDGPTVWFGTMKQGDGGATVVSVGRPPSIEPMSFERFGVSKGTEPQFALELDLGPLQPYLGMASSMLPQGPDGRGMLEQFGIVSKTPMILRVAGVNDGAESIVHMRIVNGAKAMYAESDRALVLQAADAQWLPADSVAGWVGKFDLGGFVTALVDHFNAQAEAFGIGEESDFEGDEGIGKNGAEGGAAAQVAGAGAVDRWVHEHLGLDLRRDLLAPLGDTIACHSSESLGGGFFGSAVVVTLDDAETMKRTLARLSTVLADIREPRDIGLGLRARTQPGLDAFYSLSFAGLPIPIQLSIGVGNGAMVMALSPQTAIAALAQAKAKTSILDNPGFKSMNGAAALQGANSLSWYDTPWSLRNGYGMLLALANSADCVLLPQSGPATPFVSTVPTLAELAKGSKPGLTVGRVEGDDLAYTFRGDGSMSVQLVSACAYLSGGSAMSSAMVAGMMLPALTKAQEAAREARMMSEERRFGARERVRRVRQGDDETDDGMGAGDDEGKEEDEGDGEGGR
ncbi:MAG: hypothetical protein FJ253_07930 [Phycisphaerae bacterium]|nr:hypothetical protein [Phycisphaerae bacterium]